MNTRLTRIGPLQCGKISGVLYGILGLIYLPFILLASIGDGGRFIGGLIMAAGIIIVFPIMGFIGGLITAAIFNVATSLIGGIDLTFESENEEPLI